MRKTTLCHIGTAEGRLVGGLKHSPSSGLGEREGRHANEREAGQFYRSELEKMKVRKARTDPQRGSPFMVGFGNDTKECMRALKNLDEDLSRLPLHQDSRRDQPCPPQIQRLGQNLDREAP